MLTVSELHELSKRAQCKANILGLLASLGAPQLEVKKVEEDRIFCAPSAEFVQWVESSGLFKDDKPNPKLHPGSTKGWREDTTFCSLQICVLGDDSLEIDIDLGGVKTDLVGALTHAAEVLTPGKTNHLKVRHQLSHRGVEVPEVTNGDMVALLRFEGKEIELA